MKLKIAYFVGLGIVLATTLLVLISAIGVGQIVNLRSEVNEDIDGILRQGIAEDYPFIIGIEYHEHYTSVTLDGDWRDHELGWDFRKEWLEAEDRSRKEFVLEKELRRDVDCQYERDLRENAYVWRCR